MLYMLEFNHPASENPGIDIDLFFRSFRLASQGDMEEGVALAGVTRRCVLDLGAMGQVSRPGCRW